jgi:lysophospholipid acyltransferase (LPLAT)-like uncharacterized protein
MNVTRWAVEGLARTWRTEVVGGQAVVAACAARVPVILAVWHGELLPALLHHRGDGTTLLVSGHRDGGHLARVAARWGYRLARGSSTRGGSSGLRAVVRALRAGGTVGMTPDGPRGPARMAKAGILAAAELAGAAIVPVGAAASRAWRARSWDRFMVPAPFARVSVVYGTPLRVERGRARHHEYSLRLNEALNAASARAQCLV